MRITRLSTHIGGITETYVEACAGFPRQRAGFGLSAGDRRPRGPERTGAPG